MSNPDGAAASEARERNFLHGPASPSALVAAIVNDASFADVDPVVTVKSASSDEVRGERRRLGRAKHGIVGGAVLSAATDVACIVCPSVHIGKTLCTRAERAD